MKTTTTLLRFSLIAAVVALLAVPAGVQAQGTALNFTTTSAALTDTSGTVVTVASTTGIVAPTTSTTTYIYIDNELMEVQAVNTTSKVVNVVRGVSGTRAVTHQNGAFVYAGPGSAFITFDPAGTCTAGSYPNLPVVNVRSGNIWHCQVTTTGSIWQGANFSPIQENKPRTVVAGVAYTILPTDYLVVMSTTLTGSGGVGVAVKTFTLPSHVGLQGKQIFIKDESGGLTATTNIVLAGTIDGTNSGTATVIQMKTPYQAVLLEAGSGGWFTLSCYANPGAGAGAGTVACR